MFNVEIHGEYGDDDVDVVLKDDDKELIVWTSDEWKEDPSLVAVIVNAVRVGYTEGPDGIRSRLNNTN